MKLIAMNSFPLMLMVPLGGMLMGCLSEAPSPASLDEIAQSYVKLALALGQHDLDYVDAYYGPEPWATQAEAEQRSLDQIRAQAEALLPHLRGPAAEGADEMIARRRRFLRRQLESLVARVRMLAGERLSFDEESRALYEAVAPSYGTDHYQAILDELERRLAEQGFEQGPLIERYEAFREGFIIPPDKVAAVFARAIEACRERTAAHIALPEGESFEVEYVTGQSWGAYNWYQGNFHSLIQVNTDLPISIDRAIDLACHEGYPGHHVYSALHEKHLVRDRDWIEYTLYPLFSPQSLISEGTANFGVELAFPAEDRVRFEKEVLFALAGLDPATAEVYRAVQRLVARLGDAGNEAARQYLDGELDATAAAEYLARYAALPLARAEKRVQFIDQYRSYVINYDLGLELVRRHVDARTGADGGAEQRWQEFEKLLAEPCLPSDLES